MTKRIVALGCIVITVGSICYGIAQLNSRAELLVIEMPEWMNKAHEPLAEGGKPLATALKPERLSADELEPRDSGLRDMLPATAIAGAMQESGQDMVFEARMLLHAGLAREVSEAMVDAIEGHWKVYKKLKEMGRDDKLTRRMDFLFAAWPDLGAFIRDKKVQVHIARTPESVRLASGTVTYVLSTDRKTLVAMFQTPRWRINVLFDGSCGPKELFDILFLK